MNSNDVRIGHSYRWIDASAETREMDHRVTDIFSCNERLCVQYSSSLRGKPISWATYMLPLADFARLMEPSPESTGGAASAEER